jgi:hypothetical protein
MYTLRYIILTFLAITDPRLATEKRYCLELQTVSTTVTGDGGHDFPQSFHDSTKVICCHDYYTLISVPNIVHDHWFCGRVQIQTVRANIEKFQTVSQKDSKPIKII